MVREVRLQQARAVAPRRPVFVRPARERRGVGDGDEQHLHADKEVLYALLDVLRRPSPHLVNQLQLCQAGDHDALYDQPR